MRVRHDYAGVNRESFAAHDPFLDATRNYGLKQFPQKIAFAEMAVAVLGKGRMIGNVAVPTKPAIRQIEVDLVAQPTLRANAKAIANNQHPDHQLRIDRRGTCRAARVPSHQLGDFKDEPAEGGEADAPEEHDGGHCTPQLVKHPGEQRRPLSRFACDHESDFVPIAR